MPEESRGGAKQDWRIIGIIDHFFEDDFTVLFRLSNDPELYLTGVIRIRNCDLDCLPGVLVKV